MFTYGPKNIYHDGRKFRWFLNQFLNVLSPIDQPNILISSKLFIPSSQQLCLNPPTIRLKS
ncbi:MAG: hypothetical protein AAFY76_25170 [Cyanobacteria bacterium J06649_11]